MLKNKYLQCEPSKLFEGEKGVDAKAFVSKSWFKGLPKCAFK
jgi:hypothetical protein